MNRLLFRKLQVKDAWSRMRVEKTILFMQLVLKKENRNWAKWIRRESKRARMLEMCIKMDKRTQRKWRQGLKVIKKESMIAKRTGGGGRMNGSQASKIKASHSHLQILTRGLSEWPITHPHRHIPNPERIHRCHWAHSGWHQPRRLHTPRPGQTEQRTTSSSWFICTMEQVHPMKWKSWGRRGRRTDSPGLGYCKQSLEKVGYNWWTL